MNAPIQIGKANISSISHNGKDILTVIFNGGRTYVYSPVSLSFFNEMAAAAEQESSEDFKKKFNQIKSDENISYKELK